MYKVDPILRERLRSKLQTRFANCDPRPQLHITRRTTPISTQRFWEHTRVTPTVGTRSSIAVRRPEGNLTGDMIFVAQVENDNAVIRKAEPRINLTDMVWSHVTTINNVSELSIMFDGYMKMVEGKVESYTTGNLPIVFYVDSNNSLKGWNMSTDVTFTISDTAYNVASVRGLYSEAADLNDGIFVFYTNASGELWEARVLNDEVIELTQITLLPEGVTGWVDVWASLTFDYRVVLQLKGNDGNTYSLLSASRPSGYNNIEFAEISTIISNGVCGFIPPNVTSIYVEHMDFNPHKSIIITFDSEIYNVSNADCGNFVLITDYDGIRQYHPCSTVSKIDACSIRIEFYVPIEVFEPAYISATNVKMGSINMGISNFEQRILYFGGTRGEKHYLDITGIISAGETIKAFDGKAYSKDEYSEITNVYGSGAVIRLYFSAYQNKSEYIDVQNIISGGSMFDINGVPI